MKPLPASSGDLLADRRADYAEALFASHDYVDAAALMLGALELAPGWTLGWLLAGGAFYTLGTFFYHRESIPYSHAIWHLFVIGGSVCHFVAVTRQVLP